MFIGVDIGGTKCAVVLADESGNILKREAFPTVSCSESLTKIEAIISSFMPADAIGISCGGPLDEKAGIIQSPPNLPGWDNVHITERFEKKFGIPAALCNDANACAVAEWKFGAGKGAENMIFLTFGTGMGAGLIINGKLYNGTNGNAGEIGHVRLAADGPTGYGKAGSFEGFCSGGGLRQLGIAQAEKAFAEGRHPIYCPDKTHIDTVSAKNIAAAANSGDADAVAVYDICAEMLGAGLAMLIDIFNPEVIVIGSIFARAENLLREKTEAVIRREALPQSAAVCRIVPSALGDQIGDYAAVAVAMTAKNKQ